MCVCNLLIIHIIKDIDTDNLKYAHIPKTRSNVVQQIQTPPIYIYPFEMNVVYSYHLSLNAMNSISIHEYFSGCWAETEIMILSPCTLLSWHSSSVWSTDRRHRRVSDPHFWDPERDRIRHVEAADNHLQCCQTLSHSEVMLSFCTDCSLTLQHDFLSVLFHYASEPLIYLLFWFIFFLLFDQVFL